jgi:hypothetical protein
MDVHVEWTAVAFESGLTSTDRATWREGTTAKPKTRESKKEGLTAKGGPSGKV